jgi:hypothetical protein
VPPLKADLKVIPPWMGAYSIQASMDDGLTLLAIQRNSGFQG